MAHAIFPLTHIFSAISIGHCSLSIHLSIFPLTHIFFTITITITPIHTALAMKTIIYPLTFIHSEVTDTLPLSCTFAILDCACIDI